MEAEDLPDKTEEFASIDELLSDNDENGDDMPVDKIGAHAHKQEKADLDTYNDCDVKPGIEGIFSSEALNGALLDKTLVGAVNIAKNLASDGITDVKAEVEDVIAKQIEKNEILEGLRAGLGQKKKTATTTRMRMGESTDMSSLKAKTLAEKRSKLKEDMLKYGVAAIERLYPRQGRKSHVSPMKKSSDSRSPGFRMKPVPQEFHCEEVTAKKILRPFSHSKYIRQPEGPSVVFVSRRHGLVPLSTLSIRQPRTVLSDSVSLLAGRNEALGKPAHYVRDGGRLVAVGGSRDKQNLNIKILKVPKFSSIKQKTTKLPLFKVDDEFANFAASAVQSVSSGKVDIREIKRNAKLIDLEVEKDLWKDRPLLEKILLKIDHRSKDEGTLYRSNAFMDCMESFRDSRKKAMGKTEHDETDSQIDEFKSFNIGRRHYQEILESTKPKKDIKEKLYENKEQKPHDVSEDCDGSSQELITENTWATLPKNVVPKELNMDECPPLRGYKEGSIRSLVPLPVKLTFEGNTGVDSCDVSDCICREGEAVRADSLNASMTEFGTPTTGDQTPSGSISKNKPQKIAKDLQRVKRALKTLGVNIIEFDEHDIDKNCSKDYCKLGCICDSLRTKQIPPSHCGKFECMFACCCSKEALKYSSCGSRRVNISAAVGARIQEDTQRGMAAEERKFSNTVVLTAEKDTVMIGGRGARRERKIPQRYQNANTLMLDVAGKEYVEKEASSESDMDDEEDKQIDEFEMLRKKEELIPCTVIIPMVSLPTNCSVWCMYHCQYSCPCKKYKNPLDYAPDAETGDTSLHNPKSKTSKKRKATAGKENETIKNKKIKTSEAPLLGIEDIDPDLEKKTTKPSNVKHPMSSAMKKTEVQKETAARTKGLTVKPSMRTKLIYQPVTQSKKKNKDIPDLVEIIGDDIEEISVTEDRLEISDKLDMTVAEESEKQYVRWDVLKRKFESRELDLWFWVRPGKGKNLIFMTESGEKPYIASGINLRNLAGSTGSLPSLVADCVRGLHPRDRGRYAVLNSNGRVWTLNGLMAIKGKKDLGLSTESPKSPASNAKPAARENIPVQDGSIKINLSETAQKLPKGQSLITVVEGVNQRAMMQVKLPPTLTNQYWSLISVGHGQTSIQCPDSSLVLKCAILQQAANLSTATSTTVRIPIPVAEQDPSFGVYAVPGLKSHVFVGPFASTESENEDNDEVVCLEDEKEIEIKDSPEDEDVKIIEKSEAENELEKPQIAKNKKELLHKSRMLGQIPLVITKESVDQISEVDISECSTNKNSDAKALKDSIKKLVNKNVVSSLALTSSEFGKIVRKQSDKKVSGSTIEIKYSPATGKEQSCEALLDNNGKVLLKHPSYSDHDVICPSISYAKLWLEECFDRDEEGMVEEENIFDDPEPLPSLPKPVQSPPPILRRIKTPSLPSGRSTSNISLFLQLKQQKDEAQLFYELGHTSFNKFFSRNVSRAEILNKAREEINVLTDDNKELEQTKHELKKRRAMLFEKFTKTLNGLPVARKKAAVIELKEVLKKVKEPQANRETAAVTIQHESVKTGSKTPPAASCSPTPYTDTTGIKTVRSDGSILRPMNAFMLWAKEKRGSMLSQGFGVSQVSQVTCYFFIYLFFISINCSQALADQWKTLPEAERAEYYKDAEHLKALHKIQHPEYKFSPKVKNVSTFLLCYIFFIKCNLG